MELCILHLAQGRTIFGTTTKSTTMKRYLKVAFSVSLHHKKLDPMLDTCGLEAQCIKEVLLEVTLWESRPNRREPVTVKMVLHMHKKCARKQSDIIESVLCDWIVLGIFYGFYLSELA